MKIFSVIIFFIFCLGLQAQNTITGIIQNLQGQPIDFAEIYLLNTKNELIKNTFTDEKGNFQLKEIPNGDYIIQVLYYGVKSTEQKIKVSKDISIGIIKIDNSSQLDEIVLEAREKLIERKVDRLVFNVENSVTSLGGDALDALKNTPNLTVTNKTINISGKSTVKVMINDRIVQIDGEDLMNYLKGIPASNISKIEVITNPSAKYEASGNSGLINIVLKDSKKDNWSSTLRSSYRQSTYATYNNGINFSYDKNKFSALVDLYNYHENYTFHNDINYEYPNENWQEKIDKKDSFRGYGGLTNLNYKIDDKNQIGIQYNKGYNNPKNKESGITKSYSNNNLIKDYSTNGKNKGSSNYQSLDLYYNHKFDTLGKKFDFDFEYFGANGYRDNTFVSEMNNIKKAENNITDAKNNDTHKVNSFSAKIDFYMPYEIGTFEYGLKAGSRKMNFNLFSDFTDVVNKKTILSQSDEFNYNENMQAIYASYSINFSDKWTSKIGLRGEYIQTKSNSIKNNKIEPNDYFKLFPTIYLQYKPNDNNSFNITFGRRIERPGYWDINPNRWYTNANSYSEGNPFLKPSFVYNFELNYGYNDYINLKAFYQKIQDGFGQVTIHDTEAQTQVIKTLNYYTVNNFGITASSSLKLFSWWESNNELGWKYNKSINNIPILDREYLGTTSYIKSYNSYTFTADKTFLGELNIKYTFAGKEREFSMTPSSFVNIGLKKLFLDKKLTVGLLIEDVFKNDFTKLSSEIQGIKQSSEEHWDTQSIRLSVSYRLGNSNITVEKKETSNEVETRHGGK